MKPASATVDGSRSQTVRAQLALRELVLGGELEPGTRISELALVERIGVSRTPIRMALLQLQQEGLLDTLAAGGYTAKAFTESDVHDAIELRGTLEGLAARMAAERGVGGGLLAEAADSVAGIDELLAQPALTAQCFATYVELNARPARAPVTSWLLPRTSTAACWMRSVVARAPVRNPSRASTPASPSTTWVKYCRASMPSAGCPAPG